jgi:glutamine---fructose-6-phosphate transaminase (isomerizing)
MCGIVGYIGNKSGVPVVLDGLQALEYRGYDSAGVAVINEKTGRAVKQVGRVDALRQAVTKAKLTAPLTIGHTRWATHGSPTIHNAHPHSNTNQSIFTVHNGIIENYVEIREQLQAKGYVFVSETDTEVIPHLIDYYINQKKTKSFVDAFTSAIRDLKGAYAIAAISSDNPDTLLAARLSSPLVIGVGKNEHILASDPSAIMEHTKKVIYLEDHDVAVISKDKLTIKNLKQS